MARGGVFRSEAAERAVVSALEEYAIIQLDGHGAIVHWNAGAERLTGYSAEEALGQPYDLLLVDAASDLPLDQILARALDNDSDTFERWWRRRDGGRFPVREILYAQADDGFLLVVRETAHARDTVQGADGASTIERALRDELQAAERRAAFLAESSSIIVAASLNFESTVRSLARLAVSRLADWCIIYAYDAGGRLRSAEVAHRDPRREQQLRSLRGNAVDPGADGALARIVRAGEPQTMDGLPYEVERALQDIEGAEALRAERPESVLIAPLLGRGSALGAMLLVSTGRRYDSDDVALVDELARRGAIAIDNARLFHEAQRANRAKSDFLAVMSHELRTPLNAIMGYTDLLDAEISGKLVPDQHRQLTRIRASARQLLQLIEEVLGFARLEAGTEEIHLQRLPLSEVAADAAGVVEPFARSKDLSLDVTVADRDTRIESDPGKIRQILVNLLSNAVKFTETGSVELRVRADEGFAVFEVRDTGVGIDSDQRDRIFDPFWQVERPNTRRVGGTGLGLSVSQRYARLLGGDINVTSEPGKGSCFTLRVPLRYDPHLTDGARAGGIADAEAQLRFAATRDRAAERAREGEPGD